MLNDESSVHRVELLFPFEEVKSEKQIEWNVGFFPWDGFFCLLVELLKNVENRGFVGLPNFKKVVRECATPFLFKLI